MEKSFLINRICQRIHFHFLFHFVSQCRAVPCPSSQSPCLFSTLALIYTSITIPLFLSHCLHTYSPPLLPSLSLPSPPELVYRMQAMALFKVLSSEHYKDRLLAHFQASMDGQDRPFLYSIPSTITHVYSPCTLVRSLILNSLLCKINSSTVPLHMFCTYIYTFQYL